MTVVLKSQNVFIGKLKHSFDKDFSLPFSRIIFFFNVPYKVFQTSDVQIVYTYVSLPTLDFEFLTLHHSKYLAHTSPLMKKAVLVRVSCIGTHYGFIAVFQA